MEFFSVKVNERRAKYSQNKDENEVKPWFSKILKFQPDRSEGAGIAQSV
jgi:hypothetical protein